MLMTPYYVPQHQNSFKTSGTVLLNSCHKYGLTISLKKTVTMSQANNPHILNIGGITLEDVDKFTHLGSIMTTNTTLDSEINTRLGKAASTFEKLTK